MERIEVNQGALGHLSSASTAVIRDDRHEKILRLLLFFLVVAIFLGLRFLTSPPPREWTDFFWEGARIENIAPEAQHPVFSLAGLALALMALALNRPLGFAFLLCDMLGFGQYFDLDQWGIGGWFKFRDLEFALLLMAGIFLKIYQPQAKEAFSPFRRWLFRVGLGIPAVWLLYVIATLPAQPLLITVQVTRQFYVWLLLPVMPLFIRNDRELKQATGMLLFLILLSSLLYLLQTMLPPFTVLRYSQQIFTSAGDQVRVWTPVAAIYYLGGCAIFAYLMAAERTSWALAALWGLCLLTIISMLGRIFLATFLIATMVIFFSSLKREGKHIKVLHLTALMLATLFILGFFTLLPGRLEHLSASWLGRIWEFQKEFYYGETGSFIGRWQMFAYLPSVMVHNGGNALSAMVGMGLLARTPDQLAPMIHWGLLAPPFWSDNGLAGILWSTGGLGMLLFLTFIVLMIRHLWQALGQTQGPLAHSLLIAALVYFIFTPAYMFFSCSFMGLWDEGLLLAILLALAERGLTLEQQGAGAADQG